MKSVKEIVLVALLSAVLVVAKEALAFLPNIEIVTLLLMIYARHFRRELSVMISVIFCFVEMILYGFGEWTVMYFLVWSGFALLIHSLRSKMISSSGYALIAALFGMMFGFFFSLPYYLISVNTGIAYWLSGLFFDLVHGVGNFLVCLLLFDTLDLWIPKYFTILCEDEK